MTAADHVREIAVFTEKNPQLDVVRFHLGPPTAAPRWRRGFASRPASTSSRWRAERRQRLAARRRRPRHARRVHRRLSGASCCDGDDGPRPDPRAPAGAARRRRRDPRTIAHVMETGHRPDAEGRRVPRDIVTRFECQLDGTPVFAADVYPAVAANPYFAFALRAERSGTLRPHLGRRSRLPASRDGGARGDMTRWAGAARRRRCSPSRSRRARSQARHRRSARRPASAPTRAARASTT